MSINKIQNFQLLPLMITLAMAMSLCTACSEMGEIIGRGSKDSALTLYVPLANKFDTRADGDADELKYTSLIFCAFSKDGASKTYVADLLDTDEANSNLSFYPTYKAYEIDLKEGDYHFYLLANIHGIDTSSLTEEKINQLTYNTPAGFSCTIPPTGLPMSATMDDFSLMEEDVLTSLPLDASDYYHYDGKGGNFYALLTFLYSKITVNPQDAGGIPTGISNVRFDNISSSEPVIFKDNYVYGTATDLAILSNPTISEGTPSISFYIPERYVANALEQSNLSFEIGGKNVTLPLGQSAGQEFGESYDVPSSESLREIRRGAEYVYTLGTTDNIILEVKDWNKEVLYKNFVSPVFLHIEQQVYEVNAGKTTSIWYDSNVPVTVESPQYDGKDLFSWEIEGDYINLSVNEEISKSQYDAIKGSNNNNEGKYDYIHIVAGNIHKKVTIYPLNLDYYFEVDPKAVTIDVKLRVASGEYQGDFPINVHTNYPKVQIALANGWNNLPSTDFSNPDYYAIKIRKVVDLENNQFSNQLILNGTTETLDVSGDDITFAVSFRELNSGLETWKANRTLTFTITPISEEGSVEEERKETVTINVIPALTDYTIYFKPERNDWSDPHIYVYQCLEFPADYTGTYNGKSLASQPVGYKDGNNDFAALEYSFTGAITFRGWDWPANYNVIYYPGDIPISSDNLIFSSGFYMFNGGADLSWVPKEDSSKIRYNKELDYCAGYRADIGGYCEWCPWQHQDMNIQWPGIRMKPAEDGWYYFTLTDIAEPGRTLIMFNNGHFYADGQLRFPGANQVGIPLFDFPLREGWLLYNGVETDRVNNQFVAEKPN